MTYNPSNVFAKILRKELPCSKVYENDFVLAFQTIEPRAKHHILVIPKGDFVSYSDFVANAPDKMIVAFFKGVDVVAKSIGIEDSYRLITNHGAKSGQQVFHFHIHLMRDFFGNNDC